MMDRARWLVAVLVAVVGMAQAQDMAALAREYGEREPFALDTAVDSGGVRPILLAEVTPDGEAVVRAGVGNVDPADAPMPEADKSWIRENPKKSIALGVLGTAATAYGIYEVGDSNGWWGGDKDHPGGGKRPKAPKTPSIEAGRDAVSITINGDQNAVINVNMVNMPPE